MDKAKKASVIENNQRAKGDTGSSEVQIALLTERINEITEHLKENKQDKATRRGLMQLVGKRNSLLRYLEKDNLEKFREIKKKLGIR